MILHFQPDWGLQAHGAQPDGNAACGVWGTVTRETNAVNCRKCFKSPDFKRAHHATLVKIEAENAHLTLLVFSGIDPKLFDNNIEEIKADLEKSGLLKAAERLKFEVRDRVSKLKKRTGQV